MSQRSSVPEAGRERPESVRPYLLVLVVAAALDVLLRLRILDHYIQGMAKPDVLLDWIRNGLMGSFLGLLLLFLGLMLRLLLGRLGRGPRVMRRHELRPLAMAASALTLINMVSENLAIYRLKLESYSLMFESLVLYVSVTLVFLFWYWYIDHPPRLLEPLWRRTSETQGVSMPYGIVFPEEALERDVLHTESWKPGFTDYLYFTILCSNCFGPPEGHYLVGSPIKTLHVIHSLAMLSVFIVILARAINTLT